MVGGPLGLEHHFLDKTTGDGFVFSYDKYLSRILGEKEREESRWNRNVMYSRTNFSPYQNLPVTCGDIDDSSFVLSGQLVERTHVDDLVVGNSYTFIIELVHAQNRSKATSCQEATFKARLFGDSIVSVASIDHIGSGAYRATVSVNEPGGYILEVMAMTIEGQTRAPELKVYKPPFLMNRLIYRSPHLVQFQEATLSRTLLTPKDACTINDRIDDGRWRHVTDGRCGQDVGICSGANLDESHINDKYGLNFNYVWSPYSCQVHIYNADEFHQCCKDCDYKIWTVFGDSLGREIFQNLVMTAAGFRRRDLAKSSGQAEHTINGVTFRFSNINEPEAYSKDDSTILLGNFESVHQLGTRESIQPIIERNVKWLRNIFSHCNGSENQECIYYINPSIQHEAYWSDSRLSENGFPFSQVTIERMAALNEAMRQESKAWNITTLEGEYMTKAHWSSSWDGVHYSEADEHFDPDHGNGINKGWSGGVSMMITQTLINLLCNRPCYIPRRAIQ